MYEDFRCGAIGAGASKSPETIKESGGSGEAGADGGDPVSRLLRSHGVKDLSYEAFKRIDTRERENGMKLTSIREMIAVATAR